MRPVADAALTVAREQIGHDVKRLVGGAAPFQPQPHQVHAEQRRLDLVRVVDSEDLLVADRHPVLVDAGLEPPEPFGAAAEQGERAGVVDLDVLRPQATAAASGGEGLDELHLGHRPVGVLGEQGALASDGTQRVAHRLFLHGFPGAHPGGWLKLLRPANRRSRRPLMVRRLSGESRLICVSIDIHGD